MALVARNCLLVAFAWFILSMHAFASSRVTLDLDTSNQPVLLGDWGDTWLDHSGSQLSADQVATAASAQWVPTSNDINEILSANDTLWIRFTIPPAPDAEQWYLQVEQSSIDLVTLYSRDSAGNWAATSAGDHLPVSSWPVPNRYPVFPIRLSAEEPRSYFVSIRNVGPVHAPISFISESYAYRHEQSIALVLGIYFGLATLAVAYSLLTAFTLREGVYASAALSIGLAAFDEAAISGVGGLQLWASNPWFNDRAPSILAVLAAGAMTCCALATVSMGERSRALHRAGAAVAILAIPTAAGISILPTSAHSYIVLTYCSVAAVAAISFVAWAGRRGDRHASWIFASAVPLLMAAVTRAGMEFQLVTPTFWGEHGIKIGTAIEWPLLLLILTLRNQDRLENRRRLHSLASYDPTTGLINRDEFLQRAAIALQRARRANANCALLVVRLTNVAQLADEFGKRSIADLPLQLASRILDASRHIDTVARIGRGKFGVLIEQLDEREFASIGSRFVARCLGPYARKPTGWLPQVHIAQILVRRDDRSPADILADLEMTLKAVPPWSKRTVWSV